MQLTLYLDVSSVCAYGFQCACQPQSRATPSSLCGKERLKDLYELLSAHPAACIDEFHRDPRAVSWLSERSVGRDSHDQCPSVWHRIERIFDQTVEHLMELLGIGVNFLYLMALFSS